MQISEGVIHLHLHKYLLLAEFSVRTVNYGQVR